MTNCERCGDPVHPSLNGSTGRWCSRSCRDAHSRVSQLAFYRPFRSFDGESTHDGDPRYILLADSNGRTISDKNGLSTQRCLDFLLSGEQGYNNVWFGMGLDVNMILHDLDLQGPFGSYEALHYLNHTQWGDYRITYVPRKQFIVSTGDPGSKSYRSFNSYDVHGFFQRSFESACEDWLGSVPEVIRWGKSHRQHFHSEPLCRIVEYNGTECALLVQIMDKLRAALQEADLQVSRWDGAGAIAASLMRREGFKSHYAPCPEAMNEAIACAFKGGWIDIAGCGSADCGQWDINSAYPANIRDLPDLTQLVWKSRTTKGLPDDPFALCFVRWCIPDDTLWGPLPYRTTNGTILFPPRGAGWYFACEVEAAALRFPRGVHVERAWVPCGSYSTPFASVIERAFAQRAQFKADNSPAERVIKLGTNSIFGKFAQHQKKRERYPPFQNYLYAGAITAMTRAKINHAIADVGERNVYAVMTDGILTSGSLASSKGLGSWNDENVSHAAILGAGIYQSYRSDGRVRQHRVRGFSKAPLDYEGILKRWWSHDFSDEVVPLPRFVGMGLALSSPKHRKNFLMFADLRRHLACPLMVGTTKRLPELIEHNSRFVFLPPRWPRSSDPSAPYRPALLSDLRRDEREQEDECFE